ncbi:Sfi1-domain-containing protein [Bimuria novae-zelandiae CBS 107.79]|uniref:Sfi1-domain-containing protein n=1 Tax=Bimuria novae-zelandiae CBS 107.79 TaxID=1447943 RepID=A0A6A5VRU2_9PLEO|nr:Sfi1-domain-containing protein [Bimuria novae-zelandiae CBS 107.79]
MPPSMSGAQNEDVQLNKEDVSEGAIILLYEVVERAKNIVDRARTTDPASTASRTLFDVYEEVLREHGIEIQDDTVPLQILVRLARDARADEGLVQRFRRVMGEIGFDLEYDEEGEGFEFTSVLEGTSTGARNAPPPAPVRRGSLDSLLDGSADKVAGTMDVGHALVRRDRRPSDATGQSDIGTWWQKRRTRSDTALGSNAAHQSRLPHRNIINPVAHQEPLVSQQYRPRDGRIASLPDGEHFGAQRDSITGPAQSGGSDFEGSDHTGATADLDPSSIYIPGVNAPIPDQDRRSTYHYEPEPFHLSDTRLMDDAEDFEQQRLHSLLRHCILRWREKTVEQLERYAQMMRLAIQYDKRTQFRNVKGDLLREAQNRRAFRDTDHFFDRLEERAVRARNLFLLTKAFTHWARSAEDEVLRTSVARRHILRTRFFNGWREITAVNELKIQHFVLGRFLYQWRRRIAEAQARQEQAVQLYEDNLQRRYYKSWFFKFCEIAAPAWHNARLDPRLKRATFQQWHEAVAMWTQRSALATNRRNELVQRRSMEVWRQKTGTVQALETQAESFRTQRLLADSLAAIQRHARFTPLVSQFQATTRTQRHQSTLQLWRHTAALSRQAKNVDRLRVLRNAWTAWNDRLRIKALEERINDRVLIENMYKWTLASRVSLFQRVHNRSLKENVFLTWVTKRNERLQTRLARRNRLENAEARFAQFKRTQFLRSCLRRIEAATVEKRAEEAAITVQYQMKLKQRVFEKLLDKHDHFQQLDKWAGDAQFYVLTTRVLKKWKDATHHARRNRRRDAYAQVRRTVKVNLVRRTFGVWRTKGDALAEQRQQAEEMAYVRTVQSTQTLLAQWQDRTAALLAQNAQAEQQHAERTQARFFSTWEQRLERIGTMETQALDFRQIGVEVAAVTLLKKLAWEGWEVRQRNASADALHERHFKQHVSAMLRFWHQQTASRLAVRPVSPSPTSRSRRPPRDNDDGDTRHQEYEHEDKRPLDDGAGDETRRLEAWTEFSPSALDLSFSLTPEPQPPLPPIPSQQPPPPRPTPSRPQAFPPGSALRSALRPPRIPEALDEDDDPPDATSTPLPPHLRAGPGYLKTPSKRTLIQHKRSEMLGGNSPEKRDRVARLGTMSAPPASQFVDEAAVGPGGGGLTSFQRRLKEGGYTGTGKGKSKVGFGDVSHFG